MGGCASKPKESDIPANLEKRQLETGAQDNTNGGESQNEKPSIDLSEPEKEARGSSSEPEAATSEPVPTAETAKPTEDEVKAFAKNANDKVEVTDNTTVLPVKEAKVYHNSNAAPTKEEVKSDTPPIPL